MEYTTLHHEQQQRLQEGLLNIQSSSSSSFITMSSSSSSSSSSTSSSSCYALATPPPSWSSSNHFNLNSGSSSYIPSSDVAMLNSRDDHQTMNTNNMQDLSFHWAIKDELSSNPLYPKFTDMINNSPSSSIEDLQLQSSFGDHHMMMNEKLLLRNFSSGCQIDGLQPDFYPDVVPNSSAPSRVGSFSQIFPSINISSSFSQSGMSLEALDLFNSSTGRFHNNGINFSQTALHEHLLAAATTSTADYLSHDNVRSTCSPNKRAASFNSADAKRGSRFMEPPQAAPKKSRLDSRSSCPPFKVRKEKLGDRISALQQLVAPFGKTDTASVLMEAIGYIKFLQNQVETLSVPYMKSSGKKNTRMMQEVSRDDDSEDGGGCRDLRSRGLCLLPLSCLSYVTDHAVGGVWVPPPN